MVRNYLVNSSTAKKLQKHMSRGLKKNLNRALKKTVKKSLRAPLKKLQTIYFDEENVSSQNNRISFYDLETQKFENFFTVGTR